MPCSARSQTCSPRSLPEGARAARLGGDEFVVMLPDAGADAAEALGGQIRSVLAEGLTDAGFPLRISAGISTYPFDGAKPTALLRAADQALYAAKNAGKDRVASFRDLTLVGPAVRTAERAGALEGRRRGRSDGSGAVLADAMAAAKAIEAEETVEGVCSRLCKALVFVVGATGCSASRVVGDYIVDATEHALREVSLGDEAAYRIADFPLTAEVLRSGEPRAVSFADGDVDPAEAFILRDLGMNALLMLPVTVSGTPWGLVELYEMRHRRFGEDDVAVAEFLVAQAAKRLEVVGDTDDPTSAGPPSTSCRRTTPRAVAARARGRRSGADPRGGERGRPARRRSRPPRARTRCPGGARRRRSRRGGSARRARRRARPRRSMLAATAEVRASRSAGSPRARRAPPRGRRPRARGARPRLA